MTVPRSTLSNHWRILREAGITSTHISGKTRLVTLRRNNSTPLPRLLGAVLDESPALRKLLIQQNPLEHDTADHTQCAL